MSQISSELMCSVSVSIPDVSHQWMFLLLLLQQTGQVSAHSQGVPLQILFLYHVQDRHADGTRHWVTAKLRNAKPRDTEDILHRGYIQHNFNQLLSVYWGQDQRTMWCITYKYITDLQCHRYSIVFLFMLNTSKDRDCHCFCSFV